MNRNLIGILLAVVATVVGVTCCVGSAEADPAQRTYLASVEGPTYSGFGTATATDGTTVVVGAPSAEMEGRSGAGAVDVYETVDGRDRRTRLTARFPARGDSFGSAVAVSGDTLVVGSDYDDNPTGRDSGSVYVFVKDGGAWHLQTQLTDPAGFTYEGFGASVALQGDTLVVQAALLASNGQQTNPTKVWVYERLASAWTVTATLTPPNTLGRGGPGSEVALDGDTLAIATNGDDNPDSGGAGSVWVYHREGTAWIVQTQLSAPEPRARDSFGIAVALEDDTLVASTISDIGAEPTVGVYQRTGTTWHLQSALRQGGTQTGTSYGATLALGGGRLVVGIPYQDTAAGVDAGEAWLYEVAGTDWVRTGVLNAGGRSAATGLFGYGLAAAPEVIVVGAPGYSAANGAHLFRA